MIKTRTLLTLVIAAVVVAAIFAVVFKKVSGEPEIHDIALDNSSVTHTDKFTVAEDPDISSTENTRTDQSPSQPSESAPRVYVPTTISDSESLETVEWKRSVGITPIDDLPEYLAYSEAELRKLVAEGDLLAKTWLGEKQALSGDFSGAIETLKDAVSDGSIGAALALANLYRGNKTKNFEADKVETYAWLRIAQAMGDASSTIIAAGPFRFEGEEYVIAELNYFMLLREVHEAYEAKNGTRLPFVPAPIEFPEEDNDP